jgi:GNAT superfamily N-acetyltransferase
MPTDEALLLGMESAYERAFRHGDGAPGFAMVAEPGLTRIQSAVRSPWFNSVLSTRLPCDAHDAAIARVAGLYRERGAPLLWRLGPATIDRAALAGRLRAAGFHPAPPSTAILGPIPALIAMWEVLPLPVTGVRVASVADYRRWFAVFAESFGVPLDQAPFFERVAAHAGYGPEAELQNLLIERDGVAVACATTSWRPGDGFASLFNCAVAPGRRSTGLGKYILGYAALRLRRQGCRAIGQFSTTAGVPFYLNVTPARTLGQFENWVSP